MSGAQPVIDFAELDRLRMPDDALAIVLRESRRLATESVALADAGWRVLAEPLMASEDHPPFRAATMDGYAVVAADASPWREVIGVQLAGNVIDTVVSEGYAVRITTGAPVPEGATAVVKVEATEPADDHVVILQDDVAEGENIRPVGADVAAGTQVLAAGTRLGPAEVGLAASLGCDPVPVVRRPRVAVLSTGDELREPSEPLGPGQIRDSNRFSLRAALEPLGVDLIWIGKAPDDRWELEGLLRRLIADCDVVITSGGVSMGEMDLVKALLPGLATVHFRRIFMKPGKPLNFATAGSTLIFGLSGNPVSSLVGLEFFVKPALRSLAGEATPVAPRVPVVLGQPTAPTDRIELQRAVVHVDRTGRLIGTTTGAQGSSRLASYVGANALLLIPPREVRYEAGELVTAILLAPPVGPGGG